MKTSQKFLTGLVLSILLVPAVGVAGSPEPSPQDPPVLVKKELNKLGVGSAALALGILIFGGKKSTPTPATTTTTTTTTTTN